MTQKWHINKHGVPSPCKAKTGNCPLGANETHFDTEKGAQDYVNSKSEEKYGILGTTKVKEDAFVRLDRLVENGAASEVLEELTKTLSYDKLVESTEYITRVNDIEEYVNDDDDPYEQIEQIVDILGYEKTLDELSQTLNEQDLQDSLDHVERTLHQDVDEVEEEVIKKKYTPKQKFIMNSIEEAQKIAQIYEEQMELPDFDEVTEEIYEKIDKKDLDMTIDKIKQIIKNTIIMELSE